MLYSQISLIHYYKINSDEETELTDDMAPSKMARELKYVRLNLAISGPTYGFFCQDLCK